MRNPDQTIPLISKGGFHGYGVCTNRSESTVKNKEILTVDILGVVFSFMDLYYRKNNQLPAAIMLSVSKQFETAFYNDEARKKIHAQLSALAKFYPDIQEFKKLINGSPSYCLDQISWPKLLFYTLHNFLETEKWCRFNSSVIKEIYSILSNPAENLVKTDCSEFPVPGGITCLYTEEDSEKPDEVWNWFVMFIISSTLFTILLVISSNTKQQTEALWGCSSFFLFFMLSSTYQMYSKLSQQKAIPDMIKYLEQKLAELKAPPTELQTLPGNFKLFQEAGKINSTKVKPADEISRHHVVMIR